MNISIQAIQDKQAWNTYIESLAPNTFLQTWEWGVVQEASGEKVLRVGMYVDGTQIGAANIVIVQARRGVFLLMPHGPLIEPQYMTEGLEALVMFCRGIAHHHNAVGLRIAPLIEVSPEHDQLFQRLGFRPAPIHIHAELTWVLDISASEDVVLAGMRKTTRHAVRKAEQSGVQVEILTATEGLDRFWPLYETTKDRHGFVPFSRSLLEAECDAFAANGQLIIPIATVEGRDVAGAVMVRLGNTLFYHHGASVKLPSSIPAAQYLHWQAMKYAKAIGVTRYNFWGIAPENIPSHPFAGITTFKKGFGGYAVNYMHAQDLPLSIGYWKLWLVDTWRRKKRGF